MVDKPVEICYHNLLYWTLFKVHGDMQNRKDNGEGIRCPKKLTLGRKFRDLFCDISIMETTHTHPLT